MIEVENISKSYTSQSTNGEECIKVIDSLDFKVEQNKVVCLIGPTGCGKTTLLKCIIGLLLPDKGKILVDGKSPIDPKHSIGFVFQDYVLLPWRTTHENILLGKELLLKDKFDSADKEEKITKLVTKLRLGGLSNKYPHQLSGGEKQRVGLARALFVNPKILVMDEPLSSVDAITKEVIELDLLQFMKEGDRYILISTHDIDEAVFLADRIIVLSDKPSRIIEDITIDDAPKNRDDGWRFSNRFIKYTAHLRKLLVH